MKRNHQVRKYSTPKTPSKQAKKAKTPEARSLHLNVLDPQTGRTFTELDLEPELAAAVTTAAQRDGITIEELVQRAVEHSLPLLESGRLTSDGLVNLQVQLTTAEYKLLQKALEKRNKYFTNPYSVEDYLRLGLLCEINRELTPEYPLSALESAVNRALWYIESITEAYGDLSEDAEGFGDTRLAVGAMLNAHDVSENLTAAFEASFDYATGRRGPALQAGPPGSTEQQETETRAV